jgi:hypothetical protein
MNESEGMSVAGDRIPFFVISPLTIISTAIQAGYPPEFFE